MQELSHSQLAARDAMSENMEGNDAGHFEEAGIVTDEAAGFSYKLYANLLSKQRRI